MSAESGNPQADTAENSAGESLAPASDSAQPTQVPLSSADTPEDLGGFSHEVLWEMRRQGSPKPEGVSWSAWNSRQSMRHGHERIADLMLQGRSKKKIAEETGWDYAGLVGFTNTLTYKTYFRERRKEREEALTKEGIHDLFNAAVDTLANVMQDDAEKGATRADAAKYIIDQSIGKAKQDVHVQTSVAAEILHRVEQLKKAGIEVSQSARPDRFKETVADIVPAAFTVGKKGL